MNQCLPPWTKEFGNRAAVFVNPVAGGGRARAGLSRVKAAFETCGFDTIYKETPSTEDLQQSAHAAVVQGRRILFGMGGDGTFQALANATQDSDVLLGILPFGGGNDFAAALDIPTNPAIVADLLLHGKIRSVDLVRVTTWDGRARLYVGGGGVGLDAEAARFASGPYRYFPGRSRYIASALRALISYRHIGVRIEFPDGEQEPLESRALLAGVLNTPTYGAGLKLAPNADIADGVLNCVLIERLNVLQVLQLLPRLMVSGELRTSRVKRWKVKRLRLQTDRPALFHGDGEILGPTPVEIEVVPHAIKMLAPCE
jgi:YegS/Rv2252/BmrU family lipid kinase